MGVAGFGACRPRRWLGQFFEATRGHFACARARHAAEAEAELHSSRDLHPKLQSLGQIECCSLEGPKVAITAPNGP